MIIAVLLFVGCVVVLVAPGLTATERAAVSNVVSAPLAAMTLAAVVGPVLRSAGRARLAWALLSVECGCWLVAETGNALATLLGGRWASISADASYLLSIPFGIAGLLVFPGRRWRGADRARSLIDGLTVATSLFFVGRGLGLLDWSAESLAVNLVALAYPVGDLIMLTLALTVLMRTGREHRRSVTLIAAGLTSYVVGDSVYAVQNSGTGYAAGTVLDLTWLGAYLLFALAGLAASTTVADPATVDEPHYGGRRLPWLLVGGCVGGAVAVAVVFAESASADPAMIVCGVAVALLLTVRQTWTVRDVTRLNERLSRQVQRTARISESVVDGIVVTDAGGMITFANPAAASALGCDVAQLLGTPVVDLVRHDALGVETLDEVLRALRVGTVLSEGTATLQRRGGPDVPVELSVGPLEGDGLEAGVVVVFRDVTGRRAVERMKNEFMSVISHELRTPLTSIRGALAMLDGGMGGPLQPAGSRMVTLALQSSERLSRLINDILDVERLESGTMTLARSGQDAAQLIENAVHEMSGMAMPADVRLRIGPARGRVDADPDRVVQTLTNLIGNAIKFSPAGSEIVVTAAPHGVPETGLIEFSVADQGRGVPAHKLETIFDRFEQVDSSDARRHGGTGLGLAICRDIVALHGGRIWVTHRAESGADFRFTLPTAVGSPPEPVADAVAADV